MKNPGLFLLLCLLPAIVIYANVTGNLGDYLAPFLLMLLLVALPVGIVGSLIRSSQRHFQNQNEIKEQLELLVEGQKAQLRTVTGLSRNVNPPQASDAPHLRISFGGQELGNLPLPTVQRLLQMGKLTLQDEYLDPQCNKWLPLGRCPLLL